MSQQSGYVPIQFHIVGKLFLALGIIGLILVGISTVTGWFTLPPAVLILSLIAIPLSLYLIFVVPREKEDST
ncbi:MAG: hypothetical protein GTO18_00685 [Anaerolineales bacterium]|nr:hypothetical protein [Anaerolineales bacterium]